MILFESETETDEITHVGENCHIYAEKDNGPRPNSELTEIEKNSYNNLILLCRNHHKVIDSQENTYTYDKLIAMKEGHERWVRDNLDSNEEKLFIELQYAEIIDQWEKLGQIDNWDGWTSSLLSADQPRLAPSVCDDLEQLRKYLLVRVWPNEHVKLEDAFENFRRVLEALQNLFLEQIDETRQPNSLITKRFYKINEWNPELYHHY